MDIDLSFIKEDYFLDILEENLNQLFNINKNIKGILLFGSLAREEAIYSEKKIIDIDIIVIFANNELPTNHNERTNLKIKLMELKDLGFDSIWMTEDEFKHIVDIKADIILSSLSEGKTLFDPENIIKTQKEKLLNDLKRKGVKKRKDYWIWPIKKIGDEINW